MQMQNIFMRTIADCCHRRTPSAEHSNERNANRKVDKERMNKKNLGKKFHYSKMDERKNE